MEFNRIMRRFANILATLGLGLTAVFAYGAPVSAAVKCYENWTVAAPLVRAKGLVPIDRLTELARSKLNSEVVRSTLCLESSVYFYRLVVRDEDGYLRSIVVDAKRPFE